MSTVRKEADAAWGRLAEKMVYEYFVGKGYVVRDVNWRPPHTHLEIDLIAEKDGVIIFVEVKARSGRHNDPEDAVDLKKMRNMARAADIYLRALPYDFDYRFDIITLKGTPADYTFEHYEDAFLSPLNGIR